MIAVTAGVAAPLTILAAALAVALLAFTAVEFTKAEPSAGSFITYVETSLGSRAGVVTALLVAVGYTVAIAGVFTMSGGMVALTLAHYTSLHPPWEPISLTLTIAAIWLTTRGVKLAAATVALAVMVQVVVMLAVCIVVLIDQSANLSAVPFSPSHLTGGLAGLSAGFPLALFMFIGWENGPALAEEARDPKRTIPRAIYISVAIGAVLFVTFAYATVTGFGYDVSSIGRSSIPFLAVADRYLGGAAILAWLTGTVSVLATLIAGANSQARMLFDGGRSGLLPAWLGRVREPSETPVNALLLMACPHHRRGHRVHEPRRPLCRVLHHGDDRDPVRVRADDALAAALHVASTSRALLGGPACPHASPRSARAGHPVRGAVQAGAARSIQPVPLHRDSDRGGGHRDRVPCRPPSPNHGLR